MAVSISFGSGKGGVGKSMLVANMAIFLAKAGFKVCIADLDISGADIHILFGLFEPKRSISDFLSHQINSLDEIATTFNYFGGIRLLPGTGDTLQNANLTFKEKQRLIKAINQVDADVLLVDVGAGASLHTLDFFMMTDMQICVTTPEPTAIMDFYTFLQLATIRKAMSGFLSQDEVSKALKENTFTSLAEIFAMTEALQPGAKEKIQQALYSFNPLLVVNMVGTGARLNVMKLKKLAQTYLGIYLPDLGEIPDDPALQEALRTYIPVSESVPGSAAARALAGIAAKLEKLIRLFQKKRSS